MIPSERFSPILKGLIWADFVGCVVPHLDVKFVFEKELVHKLGALFSFD